MERGALSDLSDLPQAASIRDDVLDLTNWYPTYPGRTSVIPYSVMAASVIYNRRIFEQNGLAVPTTWDELIEVCEPSRRQASLRSTALSATLGPSRRACSTTRWAAWSTSRDFYKSMHQIGEKVRPGSGRSFQKTLLEPVKRMLQLATYVNPDASSRGYGDGNPAMAQGRGGDVPAGAVGLRGDREVRPGFDLGTFPLPMTDDPADLKVRVNIDLSLWIPEVANGQDGARAFLQYLMQPEVRTRTTPNSWFRHDQGRGRRSPTPASLKCRSTTTRAASTWGPPQLIPLSNPAARTTSSRSSPEPTPRYAAPSRRRLGAPGFPRVITLRSRCTKRDHPWHQ